MTEKQAYKILTNTPIRAKGNHAEYSRALHIALGALQRQIEGIFVDDIVYSPCYNCGNAVRILSPYCNWCGQKLDWRNTE